MAGQEVARQEVAKEEIHQTKSTRQEVAERSLDKGAVRYENHQTRKPPSIVDTQKKVAKHEAGAQEFVGVETRLRRLDKILRDKKNRPAARRYTSSRHARVPHKSASAKRIVTRQDARSTKTGQQQVAQRAYHTQKGARQRFGRKKS